MEQLNGDRNILYCNSTDAGTSFSERVQVNHLDNNIVAFIQAGPKIRVRESEVIIVFMDDRTGHTSPYLSRSLDGGNSWLEEFIISDQPFLNAYPDLEIDGTGRLHVIYYNYAEGVGLQDVRYTNSPSGQVDFIPSETTVIVTENAIPCDCYQPDLMVSLVGDVYIAYRNDISDIRDHYLAVKYNGDSEFSESIRISNHNDFNQHCPSSGPSVAMNDAKIAAGYFVTQSQNAYVNISDIPNIAFSNETNVNLSDAQQNFPYIIMHDNFVHTAWLDYTSGNPDIYYGVIEIGANELINMQRVNQNEEFNYITQKDPKLYWYDNSLFCFWSDDRSGIFQIYFSKASSDVSIIGDVNEDSTVNILDVVLTVNFILTNQYNNLADLNSDGNVDVLDIILLVNIILSSN